MTLPRCMDNTTQTKGVAALPKLVGSLKANRPHSSPQETDHLKLLECKDHDGGNTNSTSGQRDGRIWNLSVRDKQDQMDKDGIKNTARW